MEIDSEEQPRNAKRSEEEEEASAIEAFPDVSRKKAKHNKEEANLLRNMGIPDWLLHPTTISPKERCDLDQVGLSERLTQRCKEIGLSSFFAGNHLQKKKRKKKR